MAVACAHRKSHTTHARHYILSIAEVAVGMSNAGKLVIQRLAGSCLPCTRWSSPVQLLRGASTSKCRPVCNPLRNSLICHPRPTTSLLQTRFLTQSTAWWSRQSVTGRGLRPRKNEEEQEEKGLAFRAQDLSQKELKEVFGDSIPPTRGANQLLRIIQGRRNDGTLDLPLSPAMRALLEQYPHAFDSGLEWLRQEHYIDEDAAIIARLEREEAGQDYSPSELEQRGQDIGLYRPQSGSYQAQLSDSGREGDVWGKSELESIRAANEAEAAKEEEELQAQIDQIIAQHQEQQDNKNKALAERPDQSLEPAQEIRPPNEFEKWVLRAKLKAESKVSMDEMVSMSFLQRVLPSAMVAALVCIASYLFAQYWTPPRRADRFMPDTSLTYATIAGIAMINVAVFVAWKLPPFWPILNKYFVMTPGYPRALSTLGAAFSHQSSWHLLSNMLGLTLLGSTLHEDIGRGTFLAIWLASGVCGSLASLVFHAARGTFVTSSLGASGSVCGTFAALSWLNAE